MKKVIELIPTMKSGYGFFSAFTDPLWGDSFPNTGGLDMFYATTYGQKWAAPFLELFIDSDTGVIDSEDVNAIASIIYQMRASEWSRLYAALMAEYNPVENTDVYENYTDQRTGSGTNGNTRTLNTTTGNQGTATVQSTANGSGSNAANKFGFDSSTAVGDTTGTDSSNTSSTTGTQTANTIQDTGTITDAGTLSNSESITHTLRRHGNIGVMTAAQLVGGEIELWKWTFIIQVMEDISHLTALSVY